MKRLSLTLLAFGVALAAVPATAFGKGPIEASIDGPGVGTPLQIGDVENWGEENAMAATQPVMQFAEAAGFFPAAFQRVPDPMLDVRPKGDLGPRYVVEYRVPGPNNTEDVILQDLYPYADPDPLTYMAPGQTLFGTQSTRGGWYVATSSQAPPLMAILTDAGLPRNPPTGGDGSPSPWTAAEVLAAAAAIVCLAAGAVVVIRRRPRPATS